MAKSWIFKILTVDELGRSFIENSLKMATTRRLLVASSGNAIFPNTNNYVARRNV